MIDGLVLSVTGAIGSLVRAAWPNIAVTMTAMVPRARTRTACWSAAALAIGAAGMAVGTACSSKACFHCFDEEFDYVYGGGTESCTVTVAAGATSAQYLFPPPPAGAPDCQVTSDACQVVRGPPATCGRSATCLAISLTGTNGDALHSFLNSDNKAITTTLQCGAGAPIVRSSIIACPVGQ